MKIKEFVSKANLKQQKIIKKLLNVLTANNPDLECAVKWNQLIFAANGDFHHWICSISITQKYVGLNFHFGSYLTDSSNLFTTGSIRFLRQIRLTGLNEIDERIISDLIHQAVNNLDEFKQTWKQK